jgi:ribose 5-phosphate isomerase B
MIAVASDHAGFKLKSVIIEYLTEQGIEFKDFGTNSPDSVDYPDYAYLVTDAITGGEADRGILICGTGLGMSIAANRVEGIRCTPCTDLFCARFSREHNDSNVLALGSRITANDLAIAVLDVWLNTEFHSDAAGGNHSRRIGKFRKGRGCGC